MSRISALIENAVELYGVRGPSFRGQYATCCPFCIAAVGKQDRKFKLQLDPAKGLYHCYRCSSSGRTNLGWLAAREPTEKPVSEAPAESLGPPEGYEPLDTAVRVHKPFIDYLAARKVLDAALRVQAGVCRTGKYAGRVIIPHRSWDTPMGAYVWRGFVARTISPGENLRYLYPRGMDRKHGVWEAPGLRTGSVLRLEHPVYVVEGVFDALPLYPYGVATFGKSVTDEQISALIALNRPLVVCLDGDAWEEGKYLAARFWLRGMDDVRWCHLPPLTDPGNLGWEVEKYVVGP